MTVKVEGLISRGSQVSVTNLTYAPYPFDYDRYTIESTKFNLVLLQIYQYT